MRLSFRRVCYVVLAVALLCDNPVERPGRRVFESVWMVVGRYVYAPLSSCLHIPGFKISLLELVFLFLAVSVFLQYPRFNHFGWRKARIHTWFMVYVGVLCVWMLYGVATGGSLRFGVLQTRTVFFLPVVVFVFSHGFSHFSDMYGVLKTLLCVCVFRSCEIVYYHFTVTRALRGVSSEGGDGYYVLTHSDAMLAAVVLTMLCVWVYEHPQLQYKALACCVLPCVLLATVLNNRRIAFVACALGLIPFVLVARNHVRKRFQFSLKVLLPLLCVYMALGWNARGASWAKPVQSVRSMFEPKDASSATRDIENYNLIYTYKKNPLLGMGFGHTYDEQVKAYDISHIFEAYLYVPHNSVLGMWSSLGLVGYALFSLFFSVVLYHASLLYMKAERAVERVFASVTMASVMAYHVMSYGDMGMQSWMCMLVVGACLGTVLGRLRVSA